MLNDWLKHSERSPNPLNFRVIDINEKDDRDLEKVNKIFKKIFVDNTLSYESFKKISAKIGWDETFAKFISPKLTKTKDMKKGKFGEMLEGEILENFFDFVIPIKKWRYAITSDQSLPSIDIVAIKNDDSEITEMSLVECKVTGGNDKRLVSKAYTQLMDDLDIEFPPMLPFIINRLIETSHPLTEMFMDYCLKKNRINDSYRISTVFDKQKWDEKSLENLNELIHQSTSNLTIDVITIESLENVITEIYKNNGWSVIE